jgi:membrane protein implicated in regulation of membrane protease activity
MTNYLSNDYMAWAWLLIGLIFIVIDIINFSIVGLIFLGLGAISTSIYLIFFNINDCQMIFFIISSLIWFLLFYKPIKDYLSKNKNSKVSDIIDSFVVVVDEAIHINSIGKVKWSGVLFNAALDSSSSSQAQVGEILQVKEIIGNRLICIKKQSSDLDNK